MKTKAQIIARIKELDEEINTVGLEIASYQKYYYEALGKLRALNWVINKD